MNNHLRELRLQRGWTMKEVGKKVGLTEAAVSQIERGLRKLNQESARNLAVLYGVSTDYILGIDDHTEQFNEPRQIKRIFSERPDVEMLYETAINSEPRYVYIANKLLEMLSHE